jgi:hypothetical protein
MPCLKYATLSLRRNADLAAWLSCSCSNTHLAAQLSLSCSNVDSNMHNNANNNTNMRNNANNIKCRVMNMELDQISTMRIQVSNKCSLLITKLSNEFMHYTKNCISIKNVLTNNNALCLFVHYVQAFMNSIATIQFHLLLHHLDPRTKIKVKGNQNPLFVIL